MNGNHYKYCLNLGQSLVGHFLCVCSIFVPSHLVGRTWFLNLMFCGWVAVFIPSLGVLPGYRRWHLQASYPPLLGVSARVTLIDSLEPPLSQVSGMS